MNKHSKWLALVMILCTLMIFMPYTIVLANSAQPPSLVILVNNPPEDLSIVLVSNGSQPKARVRRVAWEGYYAFYTSDMQVTSQYTLKVTTNGESFDCTIGTPLQHYNNVFTLNLSNRELRSGTYPFRRALLVTIRLLLTLLLEGIIFWLFNYRQKRSWIIFFYVNIVTQGVLNIWLNSGGPLMPSYLIFSLILGEFFVFMAEMIAFPILVKEHGQSRSLIYAFVANFISLIAGGYIISVLPV
ncbi:hypothetical protein JK636_14700 [Clostridium sp. YIM B02515]|uniref:Uncharacterized protein n=1 Tax=Clostridium rhizosphaerae TaxID=2803861 RepID=A0ABS1TCK7_9CLOT|nr:hypothetical protein [Clostridium rhizosphaerae]MBL4937001.1 hypothetical protein [Clostridium rhizosphaerae]